MKSSIQYLFQNPQTQEIIHYIAEEYGDELEYLWQNSPGYAIWRNKSNNKWYALLMAIPAKRLGLDSDELLEIIDLRYQKADLPKLLDGEKFLPGYHMNKSNWFTIVLDGRVDTGELKSLIDNSHQISSTK